MAVHGYDRNEIKKEMRNRLEKCIRQLLELENILLGDKRTEHCYAEAKEKISAALELFETFENSTGEAKEEKRVNEALESAEQYLKLGVFKEFTSIIQKTDQEIREIKEKIEEALENKDDESGDEWVHILHLSDLHFGIYMETGNDEQSEKEFFNVIKSQLFPFLKNYIDTEHPIDIVAVTGDISYRNRERGYYDFKEWLEELCDKELLDVDITNHVIMCPGNHDSSYKDRSQYGLIPEKCEGSKVGEILTIDKIRNRQDQFQLFNDICERLKIEPLINFDAHKSMRAVPYVMGIKKIEGIYFIVLNSAWNSFPRNEKNGSDHGQLLLGHRPVKCLFEDTEIPAGEMTVMLFHHPLAWLHEAEIRTYGKDQAEPSAVLIRQNADVILNGHVHGDIEPPDILGNKTVVFGGGTLYTDDSYLNQFEIISVNRTRHYCIQKVVCYNRQERKGYPFNWEITGEKYPMRIHYGIYRDIRDLIAKYSLGEISKEEAEQAAFERSAEVGLKAFRELFERTRYHQIKDIGKDIRLQEMASDTLEESMGKTKTMTKDGGEGEK